MSVFVAISVVDTWALIPQFDKLVDYILDMYDIHWSLKHYDATCKLLSWLTATSQICSSYLALLFTLERFISVRFPLKRAIICTKRRITTAIISIVVVAGLMASYEFYFKQTYKKGTASWYTNQKLQINDVAVVRILCR